MIHYQEKEREKVPIKLKTWRHVNKSLRRHLREGNKEEAKEDAIMIIRCLQHMGLLDDGIFR